MSGIAPDGRESRWVLVCQGNSPEIICAKLFILLIGGLKLLSPFTLFQLCWKPLADGIHPKTPAHPSVTELIIFTLREKKKSHFPSPSLHARKEGRTPEIASGPNLLLLLQHWQGQGDTGPHSAFEESFFWPH